MTVCPYVFWNECPGSRRSRDQLSKQPEQAQIVGTFPEMHACDLTADVPLRDSG